MNRETKKYINIAVIVAVTTLIVYLCVHNISLFAGILRTALNAMTPFFLGIAIAYVVGILMTGYEKIYFKNSTSRIVKKTRRPMCMVLAYGSIILLFVFILKLVIPQLILCAGIIVKEVPRTMENLYDWLMKQNELKVFLNDTITNTEIDWKELISNVGNAVVTGTGGLVNALVKMLSVTLTMVVQVVVAIIFSIYMLAGKERLCNQLNKIFSVYCKESVYAVIRYVVKVVNETFRSFVIGQCTEAVIIGTLCVLGMKLLGFPYAGMIGTVIGMTALIPVVGAYIGAGIGAFMICTVSPIDALWFLVFLVILQQLEGNLIYPRVVGTSVGLPGIWVLFSVIVCGGIWGILGTLLGVPVVATIYKLLKADVARKYVASALTQQEETESEEETEVVEANEETELSQE